MFQVRLRNFSIGNEPALDRRQSAKLQVHEYIPTHTYLYNSLKYDKSNGTNNIGINSNNT